MPLLRHHSSFAGTIDGAASASSWLRGVAEREHFADKLTFALELCLEELFTNVVRHGGAGQWDEAARADLPSPLSIEIVLEIERDVVVMTIEDNGHPFDVTQAPGRPIGQPLEEVVPGGLGMQLIRSFSREMRYEPLLHGNRVLLTFERQQLAQATAAG